MSSGEAQIYSKCSVFSQGTWSARRLRGACVIPSSSQVSFFQTFDGEGGDTGEVIEETILQQIHQLGILCGVDLNSIQRRCLRYVSRG